MIHPLVAQLATPIRKLLPLSDRVCPRQGRKAQWRRFENGRDAFFELTMQRISACK